jgi:hypothetical protein
MPKTAAYCKALLNTQPGSASAAVMPGDSQGARVLASCMQVAQAGTGMAMCVVAMLIGHSGWLWRKASAGYSTQPHDRGLPVQQHGALEPQAAGSSLQEVLHQLHTSYVITAPRTRMAAAASTRSHEACTGAMPTAPAPVRAACP